MVTVSAELRRPRLVAGKTDMEWGMVSYWLFHPVVSFGQLLMIGMGTEIRNRQESIPPKRVELKYRGEMVVFLNLASC